MGFCWNGFGWGGWGGLGTAGLIPNVLFFVAVLVVLGVGTAWLVRRLSRSPLAPAAGVDPLEIARRRLAAGEITIAEFEEISGRLQP
jgi:uncharacterized membrane protein